MTDKNYNDKSDDDILEEAKARYEIAREGWTAYNQSAQDTLKFLSGDQWDNQLKMNRDNAGLPSLRVNKLPSFLRQLTNEIRQNTPSIQIDPKDDTTGEDTAEVLSGLIRTIQNESDATTAYDTAASYAASVGMGFFRIVNEYVSIDSFDQKLVVKAIDDPATVLLDPTHRDAAGSDMSYAFIVTTMLKDDYLRTYPESKMASDVAISGWTANNTIWVTESEVLIAEYYYKEYEERKLFSIYDKVAKTTISTFTPDVDLLKTGQQVVVKTSMRQVPIIKWCKLNDKEVLEKTDWPGQFIPVIPVKGEEMWVNSKRVLKGAAQDAVDSQRALNYFFSLQAELVQLAPKTPFIGEIRQFMNFESLWRNANVAPNAYLPYNAVSLDGQPLPPPQRQSVEVPIQAAAAVCAQADNNLKSIFGIFSDQLGEASNAESGKAILARQKQSHTTNYHWYDNCIRSITHAGRIMVEAIPVFYDTERLLQITNPAGDKKAVNVNGFDPKSGKFHDLTKGKFDVVIQTGPSYSTRREESVEMMMTLLGGLPPDMQKNLLDLATANMDWPGAKEFTKRAHAMVDPNILAATEMDGQTEPEIVVVQLKNQLTQMSQQMQALNAHAGQVEQELKFSKEENNLLKMDKSIEMKKAEMDFTVDMRKLDVQEDIAVVQARLDMRKLDVQEEQLGLEKEQMLSDIASDIMDHAHSKAKHSNAEIKNVISSKTIQDPSINEGSLGSGEIN